MHNLVTNDILLVLLLEYITYLQQLLLSPVLTIFCVIYNKVHWKFSKRITIHTYIPQYPVPDSLDHESGSGMVLPTQDY